ncbi:MAG TPA: hypothetical protein VHN98_10985 [Acidimicrobiales bacterium]|nr:hypothetical protein [Acidimicrobiales bacterium]
MWFVRAVAAIAGVTLVVSTVMSAVRTFVVPRSLPVVLSRVVFLVTERAFRASLWRRRDDYAAVDRRLVFYAPVTLLALPGVWLTLVLVGYALVYGALGEPPWRAVELSGSSLLTLGFDHPTGRVAALAGFTEAALGIGLLALLITYLPTIYAAFGRRETLVSLVAVRAGSPPSAVTMLERYHRIGLMPRSDDLWDRAEVWFADVEESHSSIGALAFFRSPDPDRSWITAAGALLDGAALSLAALDVPTSPQAQLCIRSGYLALRRIADFFAVEYDHDPAPTDPISIERAEFEDALDRLAAVGAPVVADRDRAWRDFAGWRVNYDTVLLALAALTAAPRAPWSSDRATEVPRPPILGRRPRRNRRAS